MKDSLIDTTRNSINQKERLIRQSEADAGFLLCSGRGIRETTIPVHARNARTYADDVDKIGEGMKGRTRKISGLRIGWIEEVPGVSCQERTHDELIESLRETLKEAIAFNKNDAIISAGKGFKEETITA